jgi:intracellular sulfur oxidation DsrE/DsrF family protein
VVRVANGAEPPQAGTKIVFDVTAGSKTPEEINKGLERAARLLNLAGLYDVPTNQLEVTVVLHGEAAKSVLSDAAWKSRQLSESNPNLPLIQALQSAGVKVLVCGQALHHQKIQQSEVDSKVSVAASAMTVVVNRQLAGYACVLIP